ncbi:ABC transporter substrate-binding protein [Saxibacter everestensis]|uniref:ABC transporter substrate-binding protein n=1 Tax=Saxibacter everestensis TaxID=2909229 RepID=A0ABY8QPG0_9MICO|nr:ABC transporter substrate-binding protein [Brevibacteriaceae bacterium ZFBP1038]
MLTRKWVASFAALVGLSLLISGCSAGAGSSGGEDAARDDMTIALAAEPANLDFTTTDGVAIPQALMDNVYEGLVKVDQKGAIQPGLAKSWQLSDDRKTYTFALQEGVKFTDGADFTADDVKFSIERVQSDDWKISLKSKMDIVDSVEVSSPTEVKVTLKKPSNNWLFDMTTRIGAIFSKTGVDDLANTAIGTGPFKIAKWNRGQSIEFERRDDYWGEKPKLAKVTLQYFSDAVAATNAMQSGDVDVIGTLQAPELADQFKSDDKFQLIEGTTNGEVVLSMNNKRAPFDDKKVRQAVMYGVDRKAVVDTAWAGYGTMIGSMVPPTDPYYEDLTGAYPFDQEKAKQLIKEAGAEGTAVNFTVPNLPYATAISEVVVSQLKEIGLNAKIETQEFPAVWLDKTLTSHEYDMSVINHAEPRDILAVFNNPDYYVGYDNSKIKDVAAKADQGTEEEYVAGMKQVAKTITEDAASDFLFLFPNLVVADAKVTGIPQNAVGESLNLTTFSWS